MKKEKNRISYTYVKKKFASRSRISLPTAGVALACWGISLFFSVKKQGQGELNIAAWGVSSILFAIVSVYYGLTSFLEKEVNYRLAKISLGISGALLVFWMVLWILGLL